MKVALLFFIILALSVLMGIALAKDPGYALFLYQGYSVEMPLWLAVFFFLLALLVFYGAVRILASIRLYGNYLRVWNRQRKRNYAHKMLCRGLVEFIEGHWMQAEKYLTKKVKRSDAPLIHYLLAAQAAHASKQYDQRDEYLRLAYASDSSASIAIGLTQARLQLNQQQLEQALATLRHLREVAPKHEGVLEALCRLCVELKDWAGVVELLPDVKKATWIGKEELTTLEIQAYEGLLAEVTDDEVLSDVWHSLPRYAQRYPEIVFVYAQKRMAFDQADQAEKILRESLDVAWNNKLMMLYAKLETALDEQYNVAQRWLKQHPSSGELLFALARFSEKLQFWGQAQTYYESCLRISSRLEMYKCYIEFLIAQQDKDKALAKSLEALSCTLY